MLDPDPGGGHTVKLGLVQLCRFAYYLYDHIVRKASKLNKRSIRRWNVCAAFFSPKGIKMYSNNPKGVQIAVFGMSSAAIGT